MQSKVISTAFKFWMPDGHTSEALAVGDVRDFGAATSGLMQTDLIEPADELPVEKVAEPEKETEQPESVEIEPIVETPVVAERRSPGRPKKY